MSTPTALYIDDNQNEVKKDIERLNRDPRISVEYLAPPQDLKLSDRYEAASLFYVDWFLDEAGLNTNSVNYKGRTLATHLREKMPDKPIILLSKEQFVDREATRRFIKNLNLFNGFIGKHEVADNTDKVVNHSLLLIDGFEQLRMVPKTWGGLLSSLQADMETEASFLGAAAPPMGGVQDEDALERPSPEIGQEPPTPDIDPEQSNRYNWSVATTASWIQNVLLAYPGILYDSLFAATYLGITEEEFCRDEVQHVFEASRYTGVFAPNEGRWWRGRLMRQAISLIREAGLREPPNTGFAKAYMSIRKHSLSLSTCVYSGKQPADWVCHILKKPVRQEFSLTYHPDARPAVMDDARVSFTAIRESNEVNDQLFDKSSSDLLQTIREYGGI